MSQRRDRSGPQFRADRPVEQEAVRTTIVGGRPPGSGQSLGEIPRGIEVLVKKASVDPAFKELLLGRRAAAAEEIGLKLDPAEAMMLQAVPRRQLETIIARTTVPQEHRRAFLGKVAAAMLATVGISVSGCDAFVKGIRPDDARKPTPSKDGKDESDPPSERPKRIEPSHGDRPRPSEPEASAGGQQAQAPSSEKEDPEPPIRGTGPDRLPVTDGIRPDRIPVPEGIRPERVPMTKGTRPDRIPAPTGVPPDVPPGSPAN